uniref:Uncharacterized protein n=1 Tax=Nelumbo nucifera TaxID=4432 RepID=A0A822YRY4_NELNU|nr:TPA_asm: hypothetical protein HUJ06_004799 [Nelumbo nucifera]
MGYRRRRASLHGFLVLSAVFTGCGLLLLTLRSDVDPSFRPRLPVNYGKQEPLVVDVFSDMNASYQSGFRSDVPAERNRICATVEEMGETFAGGFGEESLRVRRIIQDHFALHGASRIRELPPEQFCRQGFVLGKASEAGFGNEMYKILTAAALSIMLNRSLIIGQTRDQFPFGDYISYTNFAFTLKEVKHLWRRNDCGGKYGRHLIVRTDNFEKPSETNVLCSNWIEWKQPIIWYSENIGEN